MIAHFLSWLHVLLSSYPLMAPVIFVIVHTLMTVFFLPCSPMTLMAGALWGGVYGLAISITAAIASSATTFLLSRSFLHSRIEAFFMRRYPKIAHLMVRAALHDWKLIAVVQMNPLLPASAMGYVFGLSRISFGRYVLFSGLFMLPLQMLFVMTGHSVGMLFTGNGKWELALGLILVVAIVPFLSKYAYKKLSRLFGVNNGA